MFTTQVWAAEAGKVIHLAGTVIAQLPGGAPRILALHSVVHEGDMVSTEKNSIVRIRLSDGGQLTFRPETRVQIESYHYDEAKPEKDNMVFNMVKGGLRAVTGAVGKRSTQDAYQGKVKAATIGIRGTRFGMLLCSDSDGSCQAFGRTLKTAEAMKQGFYFDVTEGAIAVFNEGGVREFGVGSVGFVADNKTLPIPLTDDPGLKSILPSDLSDRPGVRSVPGLSASAACEIQ